MGERPFMQLGGDELRARLAAVRAAISAAEAECFELVRELDCREDPAPVLRTLRVEKPHEVIRTARFLGDLPEFNKAFAAGEIDRAHVRIAERTVTKIRKANPSAVDHASLAKIDSVFVDAARDLAPSEFQAVGTRLITTLDPNDGDTIDPRQWARRELLIWDDPSGMVGIKGLVDPLTGSWFKATIDRWSKPNPAEQPQAEGLPAIRDPRTRGQRQADALQEACRAALGARRDPDRPHLVIHTRAESNTSGLTKAWFRRALCDADLEILTQDTNGQVLELFRKVRLATPTQRRALIARDETCVIPNCTIPAKWSDAHHVRPWAAGGLTNVSSMAMLCGRHHTETHAGIWVIEMRNGIPWVKPPTWFDPLRRWRRNTYAHHREAAEQLSMDLSPPPDDTE